MALACAVEPSELSEPDAQTVAGTDALELADELPPAAADEDDEPELELELQAVSAVTAAAVSRPTRAPVRVSFTEVPLRISRLRSATLWGPGGLSGWRG
jgi:hypothetical protein